MDIFNFNPFSVEPIDFPGMLAMVGDLLNMIFTLWMDIQDGLHHMLKGIRIVTKIIDGVIIGIKSDNIQGIPVVESIAVYHYLVGDIVFYMTYIMLLFGVTFTIIKIIMLIKKVWSEYMTLGTGGVLNMLMSKLGLKG